MNVLRMIFREMWFRKFNTLLSIGGVVAATALCVGVIITQRANIKETTRVMRDMGFNIRIIPRDSDANDYLLRGYVDETMPADSIDNLVASSALSYNHVVATLRQPIEVDGRSAMIVGLADPKYPPGQRKPPMIKPTKPGSAEVGAALATAMNLARGGELTLNGHTLAISRVMPETGTVDDMTVFTSLPDAQSVLNQPGRISEIRAIDCLCLTSDEDPAKILRSEIASLLPEGKVFLLAPMAEARARQRQQAENYAMIAVPACIAIAAVWVAVLAGINVRDRRDEIGLLRAIGKRSAMIFSLFMGRAFFIGVLGAAAGVILGAVLAINYAPSLFPITAKSVELPVELAIWTVLLGAGAAMVAALVPTATALVHDPASILRPD